MQGVPPLHREINDGNVHHAYDRDQGAGLVGALPIRYGALQSEKSEVKKEQNEFARQTCIPHPVGAPCGTSPERTGEERQERHHGPRGRHRRGVNRTHPVLRCESRRGKDRHHHVDQHAHPRGRHMNEKNAVGVSLRRINGADEKCKAKPHQEKHRRHRIKPRDGLRRDAVKPLRRKKGFFQHVNFLLTASKSAARPQRQRVPPPKQRASMRPSP